MAGSVVRLGWTNPLTGQFGAHPLLGAVLDLNDAATFTLLSPEGLELSPPERSVVPAGNVRTQGERAVRALYRHNRQARIGLILGPMQSYAALAQTVRSLLGWLNGPPQVPFTVQWQPPSASVPVYLDVVACGHDISTDEAGWLRLQLEPIAIELWVRPGLRGDLVRLSNLLSNPGFEAPMGGVGAAASAQIAFSDPFATTNAYSVLAGGAPSLSPANTYLDVVMAQVGASTVRYYRLGEASGTSVYDIGGMGQTGTTRGSPTQGVAAGLSGDTDTCYTFASASSQYVSLPAGGNLPAGNGPWSIAAWIKFAANPAANAVIAAFGTDATKSRALLYLTTSGGLVLDVDTAATTPGAALSTGTWHFVVGTYDGTTLRTVVDGVSYGTNATPGTLTLGTSYASIGSDNGSQWYWNGQLDEVSVHNAALSSAAISAIYTAGHNGASGTLGNAMSIPNAATVGFGSPAWGPIQTWQVRFRYVSGLSPYLYLHRTDGNNQLFANISGTTFNLFQRVGGTLHTLATAGVGQALVHEAWYWLQLVQFPAPPGVPPYVQATLLSDDNGVVGNQVAQIAGPTFDAVTALSGTAGFSVSGSGALVIGGLASASGAGQQVTLFGPGGWLTSSTGTGVPAFAWEQTTANTFGGGPMQSVGAARVDAAPVGTLDALWLPFNGGTPVGSCAIPLATTGAGTVLGVSAWVRSSASLGANAALRLIVNEYDASGNFLTNGVVATVSGAQLAWTQLSGTYTTQSASAAYVAVVCRVTDTSAPGASAGATVWWDNTQCWNQTSTGMSGMPYCELRAPNSPAQLLLSGLLGDLPAPAHLAFGAYLASWPLGSVLTFAIGRAAQASSTARLVGSSYGYFGAGGSPQASAALDAGGYGGFCAAALVNVSWTPRCFSLAPADAPGVYHFLQRFWSGQSTGNIANVVARTSVIQRTKPWYGDLTFDDELWDGFGAYVAPLSAGSTWTVCDAGQVQLPPQALGALTDPSQNFLTPQAQWVDNTGGGGSQGQASWAALLPVDGSLLVGVLNNPNNGTVAVAQQWVWAYFDGLLTNRAGAQDGPAWGYSIEAGAAPNPAHAGGGPGTQTTGSININSGADPYLLLDPQVVVAQTGQQGVNQVVGYLADGNAAVLPFAAEIAYYPLYLWPR